MELLGEPKQRRADALGLVAERAMAGGFGGRNGREEAARSKPATANGGADADRGVSAETRVSDPRAENADRNVSAEISISEDRDEQNAAGGRADTDVSAEIPVSERPDEHESAGDHIILAPALEALDEAHFGG